MERGELRQEGGVVKTGGRKGVGAYDKGKGWLRQRGRKKVGLRQREKGEGGKPAAASWTVSKLTRRC